jgi:hypothetical protein
VEYNDQNLDQAISKLDNTRANLGGTEILEPLLYVFNQPIRANRICQIFLLSDGEVGNTEDIISSVSVNKGSYRKFSVGIGSAADAGLINGIAEVSGGKSAFVQDNDNLNTIVIDLVSSAISSAITNLEIQIDNVDSIFSILSQFLLLTITTP